MIDLNLNSEVLDYACIFAGLFLLLDAQTIALIEHLAQFEGLDLVDVLEQLDIALHIPGVEAS